MSFHSETPQINKQEQSQADAAIDQVEGDASAERGIDFLEFRRRQQRDVLVHEDEEGYRDDDVDGGQPAADGGGFFAGLGFETGFAKIASGRIPLRFALAGQPRRLSPHECVCFALHYFFDGHIRGEAQGAVAQVHGIAERHHAADDGPGHPFMLL